MLKEFRQFILRGNLVDLATAVVIGAAFTAVVNALVKDLVTPLIAAIGGEPNFGELAFTINGSRFAYGDFLKALLTFLVVAADLLPGDQAGQHGCWRASGPSRRSISRRASARSACRTSRSGRRAARSVRPSLLPLRACRCGCSERGR
jgi:hypothetical protein